MNYLVDGIIFMYQPENGSSWMPGWIGDGGQFVFVQNSTLKRLAPRTTKCKLPRLFDLWNSWTFLISVYDYYSAGAV